MNISGKTIVPVGGRLLEELVDVALDALNKSVNNSEKDMSKILKEAALRVLLEGDWRAFLPGSLHLSNMILDDVAWGLENAGYTIVDLKMRLSSPGLVDIGSGLMRTIFEVGLNMDWLLGLPRYPGSSLKGAVRSAIASLMGEEYAEMIMGSSGDNGYVGSLFVSDALPVGCYFGVEDYPCLILTGDVVTPHYYRGGEPVVAEYQAEPIPVQHIAIAPGTVFRVIVGVYPRREEVINEFVKAFNSKIAMGDKSRIESSQMGFALGIGYIVASSLASGFAARSGKGYNIMLPLDDEQVKDITRDVVSLRVKIPVRSQKEAIQKSRHSGHQSSSRHRRSGRGGYRGR